MGKSNTTTSSYSPNPMTGAAFTDILGRANAVSQTPYQPYGGQMVAGLSPTQQAGIGNVNAAVGTAQPYLDTAAQYGAQGAAPVGNLSDADIGKYLNPYQKSVTDATMANINETNAQQQQQVLGNAAQRGALGGDRVGVAQAELARQQGLASNQTLAGLNAQNYTQALGTATSQQQNQQQNANRAGQAAYTFGNLGTTAQNAALQGANAQLTAGQIEQQTEQGKLSAQYQQYLQQLAFPYQQLGFYSGIAGQAGSGLGGTQTTTAPGPNVGSQVAGLGLAAAGMFLKDGGRVEGYASGGAPGPVDFINDSGGYIPKLSLPMAQSHRPNAGGTGGAPVDNLAPITKGLGGMKGFFNDPMIASLPATWGGFESTQNQGMGMSADMGGLGYADGGEVDPSEYIGQGFGDLGTYPAEPATPAQGIPLPRPRPEVADAPMGGSPPMNAVPQAAPMGGSPTPATGALPFSGGKSPYAGAISNIESGGRYDKMGPVIEPGHQLAGDRAYGKYQVMGTNVPKWTKEVLGQEMSPQEFLANPKAQDAVFNAKFGQYVQRYGSPEAASRAWFAGPGGRNNLAQTDQLGTSVASYADKFSAGMGNTGETQMADAGQSDATDFSAQSRQPSGLGGLFGGRGLSEEQRHGLMAAGLAIAGGTSPHALTNIGQGGLKGLAAMQDYRTEQRQKQSVELTAQRLAQQLEHQARTFGLEKDKFTESKRQHDLQASRPIVIGRDDYGNPKYGVLDQKTGTYKPVPGDNSITPQVSSEEPIKPPPNTTPAQLSEESELPKNAMLVSGDDVWLAGQTPGDQKMIKAMVEGRQPPPPGKALATPYWRRMVELATQYDPGFDMGRWSARVQTRKNFATGTEGRVIRSLNTVANHLGELDDAGKALDNFKSSALGHTKGANTVLNWYRENAGDPRLKRFDTAANAVSTELEKAFRGSQTAISGIKEWRKSMSHTMSPEEMKVSNETLAKLLMGQLEGLSGQYKAGMGKNADPLELLQPKAALVFQRLLGTLPDDAATPEKPAAQAAPSGGAPKVGEERQFKQGIGVWNGTGWVPKQ